MAVDSIARLQGSSGDSIVAHPLDAAPAVTSQLIHISSPDDSEVTDALQMEQHPDLQRNQVELDDFQRDPPRVLESCAEEPRARSGEGAAASAASDPAPLPQPEQHSSAAVSDLSKAHACKDLAETFVPRVSQPMLPSPPLPAFPRKAREVSEDRPSEDLVQTSGPPALPVQPPHLPSQPLAGLYRSPSPLRETIENSLRPSGKENDDARAGRMRCASPKTDFGYYLDNASDRKSVVKTKPGSSEVLRSRSPREETLATQEQCICVDENKCRSSSQILTYTEDSLQQMPIWKDYIKNLEDNSNRLSINELLQNSEGEKVHHGGIDELLQNSEGEKVHHRGTADVSLQQPLATIGRSIFRIQNQTLRHKRCLSGRLDEVEALESECEKYSKEKKKKLLHGRLHKRRINETWIKYLCGEKYETFDQEISGKVTTLSQRKVLKKVENLIFMEFIWRDLTRWCLQSLVSVLAGSIEMPCWCLFRQEKVPAEEMHGMNPILCSEERGIQNEELEINSSTFKELLEIEMDQSTKEVPNSLLISDITNHCVHTLLSQFSKHVNQTGSFIYLVSDILSNRMSSLKEYEETRCSINLVAQTKALFSVQNVHLRMKYCLISAAVSFTYPETKRIWNEIKKPFIDNALVVSRPRLPTASGNVKESELILLPKRNNITSKRIPCPSTHSGNFLKTSDAVKEIKRQNSEHIPRTSKRSSVALKCERNTEISEYTGIMEKELFENISKNTNNAPTKTYLNKEINAIKSTGKDILSKTSCDSVAKLCHDIENRNGIVQNINSPIKNKEAIKEHKVVSNQQQTSVKNFDTKFGKPSPNKNSHTNGKVETYLPSEQLQKSGIEEASLVKNVNVDLSEGDAKGGTEKKSIVDIMNVSRKKRKDEISIIKKEENIQENCHQSRGAGEFNSVSCTYNEASTTNATSKKTASRNLYSDENIEEAAWGLMSSTYLLQKPSKDIDEIMTVSDTLLPSSGVSKAEISCKHYSTVNPTRSDQSPLIRKQVSDIFPTYIETNIETSENIINMEIQRFNFDDFRGPIYNGKSNEFSEYDFDTSDLLEDDTLEKVSVLTHNFQKKEAVYFSPCLLEVEKKKKSLLNLDETEFPKGPCNNMPPNLRKEKKNTNCIVQ